MSHTKKTKNKNEDKFAIYTELIAWLYVYFSYILLWFKCKRIL